jgi:hypothetical protein
MLHIFQDSLLTNSFLNAFLSLDIVRIRVQSGNLALLRQLGIALAFSVTS